MQGQQATAMSGDRQATLNDRLNKVLETLNCQCDRISTVLCRVNGTPQKIENAAVVGKTPRPSLSLQNVVESLESVTGRLTELSNGIEYIA
jgi:hypothetical protein